MMRSLICSSLIYFSIRLPIDLSKRSIQFDNDNNAVKNYDARVFAAIPARKFATH